MLDKLSVYFGQSFLFLLGHVHGVLGGKAGQCFLPTFIIVSQGKIEKDHGSIIGEKTILAILKLKFPAIPIPQLIRLAFTEGTIKDTDLLVSDIYGASTGSLGLPKNLLASSMGKIGKLSKI